MFNVSALGALALYSGVTFKKSIRTILVPFAALFITDLLLNNIVYSAYNEGFAWFTSGAFYIYSAYLVMIALGWMIQSSPKLASVLGASVAGSLLFFLITNFGAWIGNPVYPQNTLGLIESYTAGLPFLKNTMAGNIFFSVVLIQGYVFAKAKWCKDKATVI